MQEPCICLPQFLSDHVIHNVFGKRASIHHDILEVIFETETVPELGQTLLYTTPSVWWCIESVFRVLAFWWRIFLTVDLRCNKI